MEWQSVTYFLAWAAFFALMMRYGCGAHVMGHGSKHGGSTGDGEHGSADSSSWKAPDQAVDPVCGMSVQTATAKSTVHAGQVCFFCSQACRDKFEAAPLTFIKPGAALHPQEHHHGCC